MALSPSHRFGQMIGEILEATIQPPLEELCREYKLYLDTSHPRPARRGLNKVSWRDSKGNAHDLDFVVESGGSEDRIGTPKAFIEIAWRRYTKHSRNKAQEIQGAIIPLAETYASARPFLGVVLAGVFTEGSLSQLRSHGFEVLYIRYDSILKAFAKVRIDAAFDESTPDDELAKKVAQFESITKAKRQKICESLRSEHAKELVAFLGALRHSLERTVASVVLLPLYGESIELRDAPSAIQFLEQHDSSSFMGAFVRYEVLVRFNNLDEIRGTFQAKDSAISFLRSFG